MTITLVIDILKALWNISKEMIIIYQAIETTDKISLYVEGKKEDLFSVYGKDLITLFEIVVTEQDVEIYKQNKSLFKTMIARRIIEKNVESEVDKKLLNFGLEIYFYANSLKK